MENHNPDQHAAIEPLFENPEPAAATVAPEADATACATSSDTPPDSETEISAEELLKIIAGASPEIADAIARLRHAATPAAPAASDDTPPPSPPPAPVPHPASTLGIYELLRSPSATDRHPDPADATGNVLSRPRRSVWD